MENQKQIPNAVEAESYLLGCMLIEPNIVDEVLNQLDHQDFYSKPNQNIMKAIENVYESRHSIDQVMIIDELKRMNVFEATGGLDYIYDIINSVPVVANIEAYIELIHQKRLERYLLEVVRKISDNILDGNMEFSDLLVQSEQQLMDVVNRQRVEDMRRLDLLTDEVIDIIEENKTKEGNLVGLDTGFQDLNTLTAGFKPGELIILAARPSIGKSTLALNFAANVCRAGKSVALFSLEMGSDQLIMRLLSTFSGLALNKIVAGTLTNEEMNMLMQAKTTINKFPLYIDQSSTTSLRDIRSKCQKLYRDDHLDMIVIDYLQLLSSGENRMNRVDEVGRISRGLKEMARLFKVPVIALSQLSRMIDQREDKRPVLSDLRESGSIEQDADIVMFLHREVPKKTEGEDTTKVVHSAKTELIVAKNRQGMTGSVDLIFKGAQSQFVSEKMLDRKNVEAK